MDETDGPDDIPDLEVGCDRCQGIGWIAKQDRVYPCPLCHGAGYLLTGAGEKILAFMRRNFEPMLRRLTEER